jgi:hypothetical protein
MRDEYASIGFATAKLPILGDFIAWDFFGCVFSEIETTDSSKYCS